MREAYEERDEIYTLWFINERVGIAIEADAFIETGGSKGMNERFITHDLKDRHPESLSEIKKGTKVEIPSWFETFINDM